MGLYGVEAWTRNGDAFGVYFGLFGSLAPLSRRDGVIVRRRPVVGAVDLTRVPGTVWLLCAGIGTTTFDGLKEGPLFASLVPHMQKFLGHAGLSLGAALEWTFTLGMLVCVVLVRLLY